MSNTVRKRVANALEASRSQKSSQLKTIQDQRRHFRELINNQRSDPVQEIISTSRVILIEGISGSGKDTFQKQLRQRIRNREIFEYSEGEVLQSWTQLPIKGIFNLQLKFMKLFLKHMKRVLRDRPDAIFIINRFHLSVYAVAVSKQPRLEKEYNECLDILRTMPVHVFILFVDETEIEQRTLHPERSDAWRHFQQQIIRTEGCHGRLERYSLQQKLILEVAGKQKIPFSLVRVPMYPALGVEWIGDQIPDRRESTYAIT